MPFIPEKDPTHPAAASLGPVWQNPTWHLDGSSVKTSKAMELFQQLLQKN